MPHAARDATVLGLETEYGVQVVTDEGPVDAITASELIIQAVGRGQAAWHAAWNYDDERPLSDARGWHLDRRGVNPDLLTDQVRHENVLLPNGARAYVDHAHPEYSGPEVTSALDAVLWDAAGDRIMQQAAVQVAAQPGVTARLVKNTTDGKGHSYGCHENYLLPRSVPFDRIVAQFTGFLVSRVVVTGAGRVGIGVQGERPGYQLSQRADFFEALVGLETTVNRPIVNTRDEPHADPRRHRRLHVITGDANRCEVASLVKVGSAQLVLAAIATGRCAAPALIDPLTALRTFSRDPSCRATAPCTDGVARSALDLQRHYLDAAHATAGDPAAPVIGDHERVLGEWLTILDDLDADPMRCADRLDWVAKLRLLEGLRRRHGWSWDAAGLAAADLQYADLDPSRSLFAALTRAGAVQTLVHEQAVRQAQAEPPAATRAWTRGRLLERFAGDVVAANWDSVTLLVDGRPRVIGLSDPLGHTAAELVSVWDAVTTPRLAVELLTNEAGNLNTK